MQSLKCYLKIINFSRMYKVLYITNNCQTKKLKSGHGSHWGPAPRRTGRQTVGRNITWNWTCVTALQITDLSSRQRGRPTSINQQLSKNNPREKGKYWLRVPDGCLAPGRTGRLTVGRNINLALTLSVAELVYGQPMRIPDELLTPQTYTGLPPSGCIAPGSKSP
jgi:hypothetical protein